MDHGIHDLILIYTYSHYLFASLTVHITAMYVVFVAVAISAGTPPYLAMLAFAFFSNLCMSLTHYAAGPSPILFNSGYVPQNTWWRLGFIASVVNLVILARCRFHVVESLGPLVINF